MVPILQMRKPVVEAGCKLGLTPNLGISSQLGLCPSPQEFGDTSEIGQGGGFCSQEDMVQNLAWLCVILDHFSLFSVSFLIRKMGILLGPSLLAGEKSKQVSHAEHWQCLAPR